MVGGRRNLVPAVALSRRGCPETLADPRPEQSFASKRPCP